MVFVFQYAHNSNHLLLIGINVLLVMAYNLILQKQCMEIAQGSTHRFLMFVLYINNQNFSIMYDFMLFAYDITTLFLDNRVDELDATKKRK